jgi:uncharacterized protein YbjQ (UPF0145 family)
MLLCFKKHGVDLKSSSTMILGKEIICQRSYIAPIALQDRKRPVTKEDNAELLSKAENIICTTAPILEGYRIAKTLDVITAECVFGMNIVRDFFASITDVVGGRSKASQNVLRDARKTCLWELRKEAAEIGADAVIAIDLDYNEFSGGGKSMLFLVASGTAVKLAPCSTSTHDGNETSTSG